MRFALLFLLACGPQVQPVPVQEPSTAPLVTSSATAPTPTAHRSGADRDGDGIADEVDQCPSDAEDFDGFQDEDGCPDPDNDRDGIFDADDRCPNIPGPRPDGCPKSGTGNDRDGDGIPDNVDKCPDAPEDKDGFQDADGCPDPDNDGDGILDMNDKCPNVPSKKPDGCP